MIWLLLLGGFLLVGVNAAAVAVLLLLAQPRLNPTQN